MWKKISDALFGSNGKKNNPVRSILVVEDSETDRRLIQGILKKRNYAVLEAKDGESGLTAARTQQPDLIIMDCMLPGINGTEAGRRLKADEKTKDIPILFLTGLNTPSNLISCFEAGADQYLTKPINAKTLISHIEEVFQELEKS